MPDSEASVSAPEEKAIRRRSAIGSPYFDLASIEEAAKKLHSLAAGKCERVQFADLLGYKSANNGSFMSRLASAKQFGLIEPVGNDVVLSKTGRMLAAPVTDDDAANARVTAFLNVELYSAVYNKFHGQSLPQEEGLKNFLVQMGVTADRAPGAIATMMASAEHAGFFKGGDRRRLLRPLSSSRTHSDGGEDEQRPASRAPGAAQVSVLPTDSAPAQDVSPPPETRIHPAILGLLNDMPASGAVISQGRRDALVQAFTAVIAFVYPVANSSGHGE